MSMLIQCEKSARPLEDDTLFWLPPDYLGIFGFRKPKRWYKRNNLKLLIKKGLS